MPVRTLFGKRAVALVARWGRLSVGAATPRRLRRRCGVLVAAAPLEQMVALELARHSQFTGLSREKRHDSAHHPAQRQEWCCRFHPGNRILQHAAPPRQAVVMLEYKGENHGLRRPENLKDCTVRMKEFFNYYLRDQAPPEMACGRRPALVDERSARRAGSGQEDHRGEIRRQEVSREEGRRARELSRLLDHDLRTGGCRNAIDRNRDRCLT